MLFKVKVTYRLKIFEGGGTGPPGPPPRSAPVHVTKMCDIWLRQRTTQSTR